MSTVTAVTTNGSAAPKDAVARGLGAFSFALGVPQVTAPGRMSRIIGVRDDARSRLWMRVVGAREIAAGVGIFSDRVPKQWVWARVAGDTMDLALLASALRSRRRALQPGRTVAATGAVLGAFAADVYDAIRLTRGAAAAGDRGADEQPVHVKATITVRRDRDECYAYWREFEHFPAFMAHVEEVSAGSGARSHWKARGPLGTKVEWDAQITDDTPGERISWRSVEGSKIENSGTVRFVTAPAEQGTEIHVELRYAPPAGAVGATLAKLFGEEPAISVKDDLRRFKQILETGEIARSDGSPEGQLGRRQIKPRPAHPLSDAEREKIGGAA